MYDPRERRPERGTEDLRTRQCRYGDEQAAYVWSGTQGNQGWIIVRDQNIVWRLRIASAPAQWRNVTKTQVLTQLKRYAAKQARRIGSA